MPSQIRQENCGDLDLYDALMTFESDTTVHRKRRA